MTTPVRLEPPDIIAYEVRGHVVLTKAPDGSQLVAFVPHGTDMMFDLAEQDTAFWRGWFHKLDEPRRAREEWLRSPHNPHGSFEDYDPEDITRAACEEAESRE